MKMRKWIWENENEMHDNVDTDFVKIEIKS